MIPIQNIFYMLSYAFQVLKQQGYKDIATEQFNNVAELCAAILVKGISAQLKRGLDKEFIPRIEVLSTLRGKIEINDSIKTSTILKKQMVCTYDEFSVNSYINRIVKTTFELLLRSDISREIKKKLRKQIIFFGEVESLDITNINWKLRYNWNNQTYRMLVSICYLVIKGLLQTNTSGTTRLMDFLDEQRMCRLYEKFILEYFRCEFPSINISASQIPWQLDDDNDIMLPVMQTDIMLSMNRSILIIDAKYYANTTQVLYDTHTLHSANLYQIFTYVKNKAAECKEYSCEVSGMLLYAKTDETVLPDHSYIMSGNKISVRTLDLNCDFKHIARELNKIVIDYFDLPKEKSYNTEKRVLMETES